MDTHHNIPLEHHPWPPYIPKGARVLIMGTFPPQPHRWAMDFYYPNRTNDFWPMMGLIFIGNRRALLDTENNSFNLSAIKALLDEKGIAITDTGRAVRRLKNNASDKFLEIVEYVQLDGLLKRMPMCHTIASTGEKAASALAEITGTPPPAKGKMVSTQDGLDIWRMPSTSRAYPLPLEQKAQFYAEMFCHIGIL